MSSEDCKAHTSLLARFSLLGFRPTARVQKRLAGADWLQLVYLRGLTGDEYGLCAGEEDS